MDLRAALGATTITIIAATSKLAIQGVAATSGSDTKDILSSMGVFGAALAIAYFMLKRGDKREQEMLNTAHAELEIVRLDLKEQAARILTVSEKYVAILVENAQLKTECERLRAMR